MRGAAFTFLRSRRFFVTTFFCIFAIRVSLPYFFLLAMVLTGPFLVRALVLVRCPRQADPFSVALAAVAVDFDHTLDVERDFSSQVALDKVVVLDDLTQLRDVVLGQILDADVGVDAGFLENLVRARSADTVDIGQTDLDAFCVGMSTPEIRAMFTPLSYPCFCLCFGFSQMIITFALALDDLALFANFS